MKKQYVVPFTDLSFDDIPRVGGKNASLGEMISVLKDEKVRVPGGFAVTADAYWYILDSGTVSTLTGKMSLRDFIKKTLAHVNTRNIASLKRKGLSIRRAIRRAHIPEDVVKDISAAYKKLEKLHGKNVDVAVRSSATAEDLPDASFAGQQETYLNIRGEDALIKSVRNCFASLFTDRAISYRQDKGFDHFSVALSVGVQKMVRSDKASSGVMFSLDTESGFPDVVLINSAWGLGEMIVQGEVIPDEFLVFKPFLEKKGLSPIIHKSLGKKERRMVYADSQKKPTRIESVEEKKRKSYTLSDKEVLELARAAIVIEKHYSEKRKTWTPMDIEWAKDGNDGKLYIVQARPETVQSQKDFSTITTYVREGDAPLVVKGASVGSHIATGKARVILDAKDMHLFQDGEILVTDMTDPDWEPIMKRAGAIVTDKGGRTSHAAIVSRELGIPCVVGTGTATRNIHTGDVITVDSTGSDGIVLAGRVPFSVSRQKVKEGKDLSVKIMMNIATPQTAFEKSFIPNDGVGLAREEFIIASDIGVHPMALVRYKELKKEYTNLSSGNSLRKKKLETIISQIDALLGDENPVDFYVDRLSYGIARIAAAFYPKEVIVRFSDFKTNEYRNLIGGELFEPQEENPMLGWRGASRYYHPDFQDAFMLELDALLKVRRDMGFDNVHVMVPFCRTPQEGRKVKKLIQSKGLLSKGLKVYVMCEIPSNVIRAEEFLDVFDGMSIGSNDLTQLVLGIDRDGHGAVRTIANETDEAVLHSVSSVIKTCKKRNKYIGICGQAPSDIPSFAKFLIDEGIESMSLNPDVVMKTRSYLQGSRKKKKK